jgi:undecaprenyl diphosphate synthase
LDQKHLPIHIGFIMDGNRRWAKERGLTTPQGHKAGADNLERIVDECYRLGIKHITFYAFSTENWSRPAAEVSALMTLFSRYLDDLIRRWKTRENEIYHHTRIRFLGDMSQFDRSFWDRVEYIEHMSDTMDVRMTMNIALNYGGRADILQAANRAIQEGVTQLTEQDMRDLDTDKSMALHIYNLTDAARLNGDVVEDTAAEETTEAPTDEVTEAPTEEITEAPTDAPATEAPTEAPTDAPATEAPTEAPKSGCGSALGMTAAALLVTAAAAVVLAKKD